MDDDCSVVTFGRSITTADTMSPLHSVETLTEHEMRDEQPVDRSLSPSEVKQERPGPLRFRRNLPEIQNELESPRGTCQPCSWQQISSLNGYKTTHTQGDQMKITAGISPVGNYDISNATSFASFAEKIKSENTEPRVILLPPPIGVVKQEGATMSSFPKRRQSRFDPMSAGDEEEDDGYGELGSKHPLRRVSEEKEKELAENVSLPGIQALFGADHRSPTLSSQPLFQSPSLPSLISPSASSPSTARTSRYSSLASSAPSGPGDHYGQPGWWAPDFDRSSLASASLDRGGSWGSFSPSRKDSSRQYSISQLEMDAHDEKRRRSDQPFSARSDPEEAARLQWMTQNRNASFPNSGSQNPHHVYRPSPTHPQHLHPGRPILPPPTQSPIPSTFAFAPGFSNPSTPMEHQGEHSRDGRPMMRNMSVVGGQLAPLFADLSARDRSPKGTTRHLSPPTLLPSPLNTIPPGLSRSPVNGMPDRRHSEAVMSPDGALQPSNTNTLPHPLSISSTSTPPRLAIPDRPKSTGLGPADTPRRTIGSLSSLDTPISRPGTARPFTPDTQSVTRRTSLAEMIKMKSGDDIAMAEGRYSPGGATTPVRQARHVHPSPRGPYPTGYPPSFHPAMAVSDPSLPMGDRLEPPFARPLDKPSSSDTGVHLASSPTSRLGLSPGRRRADGEINLNDTPALGGPASSLNGSRKRSAEDFRQSDRLRIKTEADVIMSGMDILAESATRRSEAERRPSAEGDSVSPGRGGEMVRGGDASGSGPRYACHYCAKTFSRPSSLRIHTYSHTGERPFVCKEPSCRRRFSVQSNLKRHAKVHQLQAQNEGRVPSSPRRQGSAGRVGSSPTYRFVPGHPSSGRVRVGSGGRQPSVGEGWSEEGDVEGEDDLEGEDEGVDELDEDP